jgi:RND family efflux transporter MFP subunit
MKRRAVVLTIVGIVALLLIGAAAGAYFANRMSANSTTKGGQPAPGASAAASQAGMKDMNGMQAQPQQPVAGTPQGKTLYQCPMHPSYISDKPGECPICNMALVPIKKEQPTAAVSNVEGHATVTIGPEGRQLIGVQTGLASKRVIKKRTRAVGIVTYDERGLSAVNLKFSGWVDKLFVKATGEAVHKGQPLMSVYSPEFLEAQRNYVLALESSAGLAARPGGEAQAFAKQSVDSARERLLLWDVTPEQITEIEQSKEPQRNIAILSKVEGVVISRDVVEGASVEAGMNLFQIADLRTVWVEADLYEYEIPLVKVGDGAAVTLSSFPGEEFAGTVTYIYPYLNKETRTVRARFEVTNADGRLKPGMYATVEIGSDLGEQLVVDEGAILYTGVREIVFVVRNEGVFEPREVVTGEHADGQAVILKGLQAGEKVVTSGNFLVDSESRLKSAASGAGMPGMPGMEMPSSGGQTGKPAGGGEKPAQEKGMEGMPGMSEPAGKSDTNTQAPKEEPKGGGMEGMPGM